MLDIGYLIFQILLSQIKVQLPRLNIGGIKFEDFKAKIALVIWIFSSEFNSSLTYSLLTNFSNCFIASFKSS